MDKKGLKIIITHENADFDSYGSLIGAKKLYPDALIAFPGSKEPQLRALLDNKLYSLYHEYKPKEEDLAHITCLILVDVSQKERIGIFAKCFELPAPPRVIIYDHHPESLSNVKSDEKHIRSLGSTTALITQILKAKDIQLDSLEATLMLLGIYEDTGSFSFNTTTEEDFIAASYLTSMGADIKFIADMIQAQLNDEMIVLQEEISENLHSYDINNHIIYVACIEKSKYIPDTPVVINKIMNTRKIDVFFLLIETGKRVHIIARSRVKEIDVSKILQHFQGGGHFAAASAVIKDKTIIQINDELINLLKIHAIPLSTASDIMITSIKYIEPEASIEEAFNQMTRYRINALPVFKDSELIGLITRQIVDSTRYHKMDTIKVKDIMGPVPPIVAPHDTIEVVQKLIIDSRSRLVMVGKNERNICGLITRMDLIRQLYEIHKYKESVALNPIHYHKENIWSKANKILKNETIKKLEVISSTAQEQSLQAYLVGGIVRDIILGIANQDIDVVIEGDAMVFAQKIHEHLGGKITIHKKFGTAAIVFSQNERIDFATSRTEYYLEIASPPVVESSYLHRDLYRRDFTINALAIKLNFENRGELIDFFGGLKDLKNRTIRVMHSLSFFDDPSRILRAIRFMNRYNFILSKETANLLEAANKESVLKKLDAHRLFLELKYILQEPNPLNAVKLMADTKVLSFIHPKIRFDTYLKQMLYDLESILSWYSLTFTEKLQKWAVFFLGLFQNLNEKERKETALSFNLPAGLAITFINYKKDLSQIFYFFRTNPSPSNSDLYTFLASFKTEVVLLAMSIIKKPAAKNKIKFYLTTLRFIKIEIKGADLIKLGLKEGPQLKELLRSLQRAKLDGEVHNKADEIEHIRKLLRLSSTI